MDSMKHLLIAAGIVGAVALTTTANAQVSDLAQKVGSSSLKIGSYNPDKPVVRNGAGKNIFNFEYETTIQSVQERNEISELTAHAMKTIRKVSSPEGFNLGMNQGAISGAGVAEHIHQHIVPRWSGDANFMPIIGKTKVLPQLLNLTREEISAAW